MPCRAALCAPADRLDGAVLAGGTIKIIRRRFVTFCPTTVCQPGQAG